MNYCKIFLFTIINIAIGSVPELSPNTFLFCLEPELDPLEISLNRGRLSVGLPELDDFFQSVCQVCYIKKSFLQEWL